MSPHRQLLVVLLKFPEAGKVKTRLAASIGPAAAVDVYREMVALTLKAAGQWAQGSGRDVWIYFDPGDREPQVRHWLADSLRTWTIPLALRPQRGGDLGTRLTTVFSDAFSNGYQIVMAIGTDCPELSFEEIEAAHKALGRAEMALGPTPDGGYYLIGLTRPVPAVFERIPWSTSETLAATLAAAKSAGLSVELLPPLPDVDGVEDWRSWLERSTRHRGGKTI